MISVKCCLCWQFDLGEASHSGGSELVVAWEMSRHSGRVGLRLRSPLSESFILMIHTFGSDAQAVSTIRARHWLASRRSPLAFFVSFLIPALRKIDEPARVGKNAQSESKTCAACPADIRSAGILVRVRS